MKYFVWIVLIIITIGRVFGQHQELSEKPNIWNNVTPKKDTTKLLDALRFGTIHGHFRYFLSMTDNTSNLSDYYAQAIGGGLRFESKSFYNFNIAVSGFYIFPLKSSDLWAKDSITGQINRYELGLFDLKNTDDLSEFNLLEELYLQYQYKNISAKFGRQLINTPFINLQDGRMRPTSVEGFWVEGKINNKSRLQGGWMFGIGPRSTSQWFSMGASIGIYPSGVGIDGKKSNYYNNTTTGGVGMINYQFKPTNNFKADIWYNYIQNISNTYLIQIEKKYTLSNSELQFGFQGAAQTKSGDGGNSDMALAYHQNSKTVWIGGFQMSAKHGKFAQALSFNRISADGRYLMPREWGRDYFYTFMPRERNEGFGDVTAITFKVQLRRPKKLNPSILVGYFDLPDVKNFTLNKYGLSSYGQLNVDLRYKFGGSLAGLESQVLYVYKKNFGETYGDYKYQFNKTGMQLLNVVLNFKF
ncbi:MAG: OprD family outer membrane porin [Saprospiraceae bacterium]